MRGRIYIEYQNPTVLRLDRASVLSRRRWPDTAVDCSVTQSAYILEEEVLRAENSEIENLEGFEEYLDEQGLPVEDILEEEKTIKEKLEVKREDVDRLQNESHGEEVGLMVDFVQPERTETGVPHSIEPVAGGYAALVEAGHESELIEATIFDRGLNSFGSFHLLHAWAEEYNSGVTSARTFGSKPWNASKFK